ncbi:MAG: hypothetical protein ABI590_03625, partial [Ilumatobacteraceae bacterium]
MSKLAHVLVCGGVTEEWKMTTALAWQSQLETLANAVRGTGVRWLTICPFSGVLSLEDRDQIFQSVIAAC